MDDRHLATYFLDLDGIQLGRLSGLLPITLYEGMKMTIHGDSQEYEVVDWAFHLGHRDERAGLRIALTPCIGRRF